MKKSIFSVDTNGAYTDVTVDTVCDGGEGLGLTAEQGSIALRFNRSQVQHLITILSQDEKSTLPMTPECLIEIYVHDPKSDCRVINVVDTSSGQQEQVFCENKKQLPELIEALTDALKVKVSI